MLAGITLEFQYRPVVGGLIGSLAGVIDAPYPLERVPLVATVSWNRCPKP